VFKSKGKVRYMKGWILIENNKAVLTTNNSFEVFTTKKELLDYYGGALGDMNTVKKIKFEIVKEK
jgi:hypothetical protein